MQIQFLPPSSAITKFGESNQEFISTQPLCFRYRPHSQGVRLINACVTLVNIPMLP